MKLSYAKLLIPLVLGSLAACGGRSAVPSAGVVPETRRFEPAQARVVSKIVGVGDSLTAGYQAGGFLGDTDVNDPFYPGLTVKPTQESGWWALLDEQASSKPLDTAIAGMYDATLSPLPLIQGPGLDNQIVPSVSAFVPFGQLKTPDACTAYHGFNQAGFLLRGSARTRMNPAATTVRNVAVPGLTLHEANVLHQPQTTTCKPIPGIPGLLSNVVSEESGTFWPVLRDFTNLGPHLTEANAAASRHPTLATVWLGANDVLKYMGSGGRFVGGDRNPGQAASDLKATISTLQNAGARVVVANLPNILETGYFQRMTLVPKTKRDCALETYASCFLMPVGGLPASVLPQIAHQYHLETPGGCVPTSESKPCGYLTLPAVILIATYYNPNGGVLPNLDCPKPAPGCKPKPGSGLGSNYITPAFAGKIQALNDAINTGIGNAASETHVPLVDIQAIFEGLASKNPSNPYFAQAASINPGICCSIGYGAGILSYDGLHPSNTGYALIAYDFIATINKAYGTHIPEVDVRGVYDGTRCSNKKYCFPDPYAPH
jgi:lysophospholipase L1-like esterase